MEVGKWRNKRRNRNTQPGKQQNARREKKLKIFANLKSKHHQAEMKEKVNKETTEYQPLNQRIKYMGRVVFELLRQTRQGKKKIKKTGKWEEK